MQLASEHVLARTTKQCIGETLAPCMRKRTGSIPLRHSAFFFYTLCSLMIALGLFSSFWNQSMIEINQNCAERNWCLVFFLNLMYFMRSRYSGQLTIFQLQLICCDQHGTRLFTATLHLAKPCCPDFMNIPTLFVTKEFRCSSFHLFISRYPSFSLNSLIYSNIINQR